MKSLSAPLVLIVAASIGLLVGSRPTPTLSNFLPRLIAPASTDDVSGCRVTDGDTIRCGDERIRLLGIDAPELAGHCRAGRHCAPGNGETSKESLAGAMAGTMKITRYGTDHYGRTLAMIEGPEGDLSCFQLRAHEAVYKPKWDDGAHVAAECPAAAH